MGDSADNIQGIYRMGPKKTAKYLEEYPMGSRMEAVIKIWKEKHPQDWEEKLLTCGKLIHILKSFEDELRISNVKYFSKNFPKNFARRGILVDFQKYVIWTFLSQISPYYDNMEERHFLKNFPKILQGMDILRMMVSWGINEDKSKLRTN